MSASVSMTTSPAAQPSTEPAGARSSMKPVPSVKVTVPLSADASVGVVVPTRGQRPDRLRAATLAVLGQDHPGLIEVVVVVDGGDPVPVAGLLADLIASPYPVPGTGPVLPRGVRVTTNRLTPGLPGARNTGIAALGTDLVAFCDDDDQWLPGKVRAQVAALAAEPDARFSSCSIEVQHGSRRTPRLAGTCHVTREHLVRSRMVMVHSSTFLFRRGGLWVDESAPHGQNEDWDLALRAAAHRPIVHVDRPLVRVRWGGSSYATRWADRIAGLEWMLARHPDLAVDPRGAARVYGQLAFHHAALGRRREAGRWAWRAFSTRRCEPRAPLALAVAAGLISPETLLGVLQHRGHGI
ncbi:glycosyltransferase involved in cell wall biosynthesis [Streptosporangium becharense]|uniref:Glycosyltransferase involved in cell wall biosynthesis n=1 Tax=Streptosporangium becharense TaxID=1816182 RepID=A0A7W9MHE2_9ACTN|nr:glycosyltransferase [Streptosporangium becharense]MBB2913362.1 glycosyltransferase involved in cell wall biosynthesis [Streptosporangium becharense]MBB5821052.1 glycosyltransferase involved in cell wall biosynthesis [Streptosporangium becharense]